MVVSFSFASLPELKGMMCEPNWPLPLFFLLKHGEVDSHHFSQNGPFPRLIQKPSESFFSFSEYWGVLN